MSASSQIFHEILNQEPLVLVDFFADWCGPCQAMQPILKAAKEKLGDRVRILKIDVDKNQELSRRYEVMSIPQLMIFRNGKLVWQKTGMVQSAELVRILDGYSV